MARGLRFRASVGWEMHGSRNRFTGALTYALALFLASGPGQAAAAGKAYRWIDPTTGAVVFSDTLPPADWPVRDLERIELPEPRTVPAFRPPRGLPDAGADTRRAAPEPPQAPYGRVWILWPSDDEAVRANAGNVTVRIGLEPQRLRPGDAVVLYLDGVPVVRASRLDIELENVDRGTHTLQAAVVDPAGETLVRSEPVSFHLLRASRLFPRAPVNPAVPRETRQGGPPGKR